MQACLAATPNEVYGASEISDCKQFFRNQLTTPCCRMLGADFVFWLYRRGRVYVACACILALALSVCVIFSSPADALQQVGLLSTNEGAVFSRGSLAAAERYVRRSKHCGGAYTWPYFFHCSSTAWKEWSSFSKAQRAYMPFFFNQDIEIQATITITKHKDLGLQTTIIIPRAAIYMLVLLEILGKPLHIICRPGEKKRTQRERERFYVFPASLTHYLNHMHDAGLKRSPPCQDLAPMMNFSSHTPQIPHTTR